MTDVVDVFPSTGPVPCADHPDVETRLRCSRCGRPICPRCSVRTPVGVRCPDCGGTRSSVAANPAETLAAAGAGFAVATVVGIAWGFFPDWQFYFALLLGFGSVETMVRLLTKQRGPDLQAIGIAIVVFGLLLSRVVLAQRLGVNLAEIDIVRPAVQRALYLRPVPDLLFAVLPVVVAWIRFR